MGIRNLPTIIHHAKHMLRLKSSSPTDYPVATNSEVPKGHFAIYIGEKQKEKNRFVVPLSYLKEPLFQDLLNKAEEEYGFYHPMGALTIPCSEDAFLTVAFHLSKDK